MTYAHVTSLLKETGVSPEALAARIGISGMTVRRWRACPPRQPLPPLYEKGFVAAAYQMVAEGRLSPQSRIVHEAMRRHLPPPSVTIAHLECADEMAAPQGSHEDRVITCLAKIGMNPLRRARVRRCRRRIQAFNANGKAWASRITVLWAAIHSKRLSPAQQLVAYGALFYLLTPLDFIPDTIPTFGLVDDFAVLGIAAAYYARMAARRSRRTKGRAS